MHGGKAFWGLKQGDKVEREKNPAIISFGI